MALIWLRSMFAISVLTITAAGMSILPRAPLKSQSLFFRCEDERNAQRTLSKQAFLRKTNPAPLRHFTCPYPSCGRAFSKKWNLQAHERLHTGRKPFVCRLGCGEWHMWMSSRKGHELNRCPFSIKSTTRRRAVSKASSCTRRNHGGAALYNTTFQQTVAENYVSQGPSSPHSISALCIKKDEQKQEKEVTVSTFSRAPLLVEQSASECIRNATDGVIDDADVERAASSFVEDAAPVLEDVSLPDSANFTEDFLEWFLTGKEVGQL